MAREVQVSLLPPRIPQPLGAEIGVRFQSALAIGGDMYDFVEYSKKVTAICLGDVSGKGAPAALYAALVSGLLRSVAREKLRPAKMLECLNATLHERKLETQFCSMVYATWDAGGRKMRFANSGGPRPIFCRAGETTIVEATGLPLGMFDYAAYDEVALSIQSNDIVVFFSDGMVDAPPLTSRAPSSTPSKSTPPIRRRSMTKLSSSSRLCKWVLAPLPPGGICGLVLGNFSGLSVDFSVS